MSLMHALAILLKRNWFIPTAQQNLSGFNNFTRVTHFRQITTSNRRETGCTTCLAHLSHRGCASSPAYNSSVVRKAEACHARWVCLDIKTIVLFRTDLLALVWQALTRIMIQQYRLPASITYLNANEKQVASASVRAPMAKPLACELGSDGSQPLLPVVEI